jgi:3-phenylpropionate/cinnamic acid dioxygenase small subunit
MADDSPGGAAAVMLQAEVQDFLFREADLIDERRFEQWLDMFSDDLQYRVPMARNLRAQQIEHEYLEGPVDISWLDEGKATLVRRVAQIRTGVHWAEEPLSRTAHLVSNVRVVNATPTVGDAQEVEVSCRFLVYRNRNTDQEDTLIGRRSDRLRRNEGSWLICRRTVYIAQSVLLANSLSFLI